MRKLYDISLPIHASMVVYKDNPDKRPSIQVMRDFDQGARESRLALDMHTGTHVDAPLHFVPGGQTIDAVSLQRLLRPCRVLDFTQNEESIARLDLAEKNIVRGDFVLLRTRNSFEQRASFDPEFVYLTADGAQYLAEVGVDGVGIDALGIERSQPDHETHKTLLSSGILIIEGLNLVQVPEGQYMMSALPLAVTGAEAAPARVVLWQD